MNAPASSAAHDRLARLDRYLQEDPANPELLADAFETALACAQQDRALEYVEMAERRALDPTGWMFRRARLCIARKDLDHAAELLERVRERAGDQPVLAHDLAYVRLLQGDFAGCRSLLQPWLHAGRDEPADTGAPDVQEAVQVLWLRATHHLHQLDEAWEFVSAKNGVGDLRPAAQGVASLIAVDRGDFQAARSLADAALAVAGGPVEALVARAMVALALGEHETATKLLQRALERNPEDGRTWSALGFASLQARDLHMARQHLERAVRTLPDHIGTWHALGWTRLLQGDRAGALQVFEQALALDRNFAESHGALGLVLALTGDQARANHHLDLADGLDRGNVTGRYARALLAGEAGDVEKLNELAMRLLDRPGLFGGKLSDALIRD
jgi:tetratricopeptide (TPR) repeat protein